MQDSREVLILTDDRGEVTIPKYEIKELREIQPGDLTQTGEFIPEQVFATRYFITTNGLPIKKGESYVLWNLWGPDFQFGVGENVSVGVLTSWVGIPIIGSVKYSFQVGENAFMGVGSLLGTGSWAAPEFGLALPYGSLTLGSRRDNINFSGGYGLVWGSGNQGGQVLLSVAGIKRMTKKASFVLDSFILPNVGGGDLDAGTIALILPGIRLQWKEKNAFQFGFGGLVADGELIPAPIPAVQWFMGF